MARGEVGPEHIDYNGHMNVVHYRAAFDALHRRAVRPPGAGAGQYNVRTGATLMVVEEHTRYHAELSQGDRYRILARLVGHSPKKLHYLLAMENLDGGVLAATHEELALHVDLAAAAPTRCRRPPWPPSRPWSPGPPPPPPDLGRVITPEGAVLAVQLGGQVVLEGLADGGHVDGVGEVVAVQIEVAVEGLHLLGGGGAGHGGAAELDPGPVEAALLDLDDTGGVGEDRLDHAAGLGPPVAALGVQGAAVVRAPGPLGIGQERLADMPEAQLLAIAELRDGRVPADALAPPGAEQPGQRLGLGGAAAAPARPWRVRRPRAQGRAAGG